MSHGKSERKKGVDMKNNIYRLIILLLVIVFVAGFNSTISAQSTPENIEGSVPAKKMIVGVSFQDISNPAHANMYNYMQAKAKSLGMELVMSDAKADPLKQRETVENFVNAKYDGIIIHAFDNESAEDILIHAKELGMFVIAFDTNLDVADAYFGLDNVEIGRTLAKNAAAWIEKTFPEGERVEVGIANYPLNQVCLDREVGIKEALATEAPDAEIVAIAQAGYQNEGIEVGEAFMQAHPNMKVVIGIDDAGILGIYESVVAAGKAADDFGLFAVDALPEAVKLISEDTIYRSTIHLDLNSIGEQMIQTAYDLENGKEVEKVVFFPQIQITIDNAQEFLTK